MALVESDSLVIKTYNLAEAHKIVVLFTRDHGIVRAVAKGAKRLKSKFGSGLEPFSEVRASYYQKDNLELVSLEKIEMIRSVFDRASDHAFLLKFSSLGDLLIAFLPPHDPNEAVYRMARACLEQAVADPEGLDAISVYFQLWLLRLTGFMPDWQVCRECHRALDNVEEGDLQAGFELLCSKCRRSRSARRMDAAHRQIVSSIIGSSPARFAHKVHGSNEYIGELSNILKLLISHSLGRDIPNGANLTTAV